MLSKLILGVDRGTQMRKGWFPELCCVHPLLSACTVHTSCLWSPIGPHQPVIFWLFVTYDMSLPVGLIVVLAWHN